MSQKADCYIGMVIGFAYHTEHWLSGPATLLYVNIWAASLQHCKLISCNYTAGIPLHHVQV